MTDETATADDELLTVAEVASLLKMSRRYVYDYIRADSLRALNLNKGGKRASLRVRRSAVDAFLAEREAS